MSINDLFGLHAVLLGATQMVFRMHVRELVEAVNRRVQQATSASR